MEASPSELTYGPALPLFPPARSEPVANERSYLRHGSQIGYFRLRYRE